jgi:outer membrane biogenesis lipoprotein LolB
MLSVALLASCQSIDQNLPADWAMQGTMIIRTPAQAERVNIAWRQFQGESEIILTGPLGASLARISAVDGGYRLERPGEADLSAPDLESLVALAVGLQLPVAAVVPILSGDQRRAESGSWRLNTVKVDDTGRAERIEIQGPEASIRLSIRSWR